MICYFDYSNFGDIINFKVGFKWCVNEDLIVCGIWFEVFCVFLLLELFLGNSDSFVIF